MEVEEIEQDVAVHWIERLMPPVVTGAVVAVIGLNLASVPIKNMAPTGFDTWMQALTFLCVGLIAVYTRGMVQRLLILMGLIAASLIYAVLTNGLGLGKPIDLGPLAAAAWFGLPKFAAPVFEVNAMLLIAPVAVILVAENLGHIKAVERDDGARPQPLPGPRLHRRRHRDHGERRGRRDRRHHLRREHRRDGGHQDLLDRDVRGGGADRAACWASAPSSAR